MGDGWARIALPPVPLGKTLIIELDGSPEIVKSLKTLTRPTDTIARFPDGSFHILVENLTGADYLLVIAERLQRALDKRLPDGIHYRIEAVACTEGGGKMEEILKELRLSGTSLH